MSNSTPARPRHYDLMKICVKYYLRHIADIDAHMRSLEEEMSWLREHMEGVRSPRLGPAGKGPSTDRMASAVARLEALEAEWAELATGYAREITEAMEICDQRIPERRMVWMAWARGMTWSEVARREGYSLRRVHDLYPRGVEQIYCLMPEEFRCEPIPNSMERWVRPAP